MYYYMDVHGVIVDNMKAVRGKKFNLNVNVASTSETIPVSITPDNNQDYASYISSDYIPTPDESFTQAVLAELKIKPTKIKMTRNHKAKYSMLGMSYKGYWYKIFIVSNADWLNDVKRDVEHEYYFHKKVLELINTNNPGVNFTTPRLYGFGFHSENEPKFFYIKMEEVSMEKYKPFLPSMCDDKYDKQFNGIVNYLEEHALSHDDFHHENIFVPKTDDTLPFYIIDWGMAVNIRDSFNPSRTPCSHMKKRGGTRKLKKRKKNNKSRRRNKRAKSQTIATY